MSFTFAGSAAALTATFFNSVQVPDYPQPAFPQMDAALTEMIVPQTGFDDAGAYDVAGNKEEKRLRKLIKKLEKENDEYRREERREDRRDRDRHSDRRDRDEVHYCGDGHYHQGCGRTVDRDHDGWDSDGDGRDRDDGHRNRQRRQDKGGLSDTEKAAVAGVVILGLGAIANQVMNGGGQPRPPSNVLTDGKITRGEYSSYDVLGRATNGLVYVDVTLRNGAVICGAGGRNDSITREGVGIVQMSPCND